MPGSPDDEVEVLAGTHGSLRWQVWAGGTADDLITMLQVLDGDRRVARHEALTCGNCRRPASLIRP